MSPSPSFGPMEGAGQVDILTGSPDRPVHQAQEQEALRRSARQTRSFAVLQDLRQGSGGVLLQHLIDRAVERVIALCTIDEELAMILDTISSTVGSVEPFAKEALLVYFSEHLQGVHPGVTEETRRGGSLPSS